MNTFHRLIAMPFALVLSAAAFGDDPVAGADAAANPDAVAKLKSSLTRTTGFEVDNVRTTTDGVACITYRVDNEQGTETRAHAVVQGEKVLRSTSRSKSFEKAWNEKCAAGAPKE